MPKTKNKMIIACLVLLLALPFNLFAGTVTLVKPDGTGAGVANEPYKAFYMGEDGNLVVIVNDYVNVTNPDITWTLDQANGCTINQQDGSVTANPSTAFSFRVSAQGTITAEVLPGNSTFNDNIFSWNASQGNYKAVFKAVVDANTQSQKVVNIVIMPPINAPTNLTATAVSSTQINLSWTDTSSNETGFKIERKTTGDFMQITTVGAGVTTYNNTGLTAGTTYTYRVRAYNDSGDSAYSNEASATPQLNLPTAPTGLTATAASSTQINLSWTDTSSNETGFKIERKTTGDFTQITTVGAGVTTYNNTGLTTGTQYTYRVRAYNGDGDSAYSNEASATPQLQIPAAPSSLTATAVSSSQINLSWTDNSSNETGFRIERKTTGDFAEITTVTGNTYQNTGLSASTTYTYRVRAYNGDGNSAYSNEAAATTQPGGGDTYTLGSWMTFQMSAGTQKILTFSVGSNKAGLSVKLSSSSSDTYATCKLTFPNGQENDLGSVQGMLDTINITFYNPSTGTYTVTINAINSSYLTFWAQAYPL